MTIGCKWDAEQIYCRLYPEVSHISQQIKRMQKKIERERESEQQKRTNILHKRGWKRTTTKSILEKFATEIRFWVWVSCCCGAVCVPHLLLIHSSHSVCLTFNMLCCVRFACSTSLMSMYVCRLLLPSSAFSLRISQFGFQFGMSVSRAGCVRTYYRTFAIWFRWDNNQFGWCKAN